MYNKCYELSARFFRLFFHARENRKYPEYRMLSLANKLEEGFIKISCVKNEKRVKEGGEREHKQSFTRGLKSTPYLLVYQ